MRLSSEINVQLNKIKKECYKLSDIVHFERFRIEYNKNKRINDDGKLDLIPIFHCYST
jgi:hypothetical protein